MKRIVLFLAVTVALLTVAACSDTDGDYPRTYSFVTERLAGGNASDYYFEHDDGQTLYPADRDRLPGYQGKEGRRSIIYYNFVNRSVTGYDHTIALYGVSHPRVGTTEVVTDPARLEALGDAPVELIVDRSTTRKWLNIGIEYACYEYGLHSFALIRNRTSVANASQDGYLELELHHNAGGEIPGQPVQEYASFDLALFAADLAGRKGISLRVQTPLQGARTYRIDLAAEQ